MAKSKSKMETLLNFYLASLASLDVVPQDDGYLIQQIGNKTDWLLLGDKPITLPTREVLAAGDWDNVVGYHPLSEMVTHGESPMIKLLRNLTTIKLEFVANSLVLNLLHIAANDKILSKLTSNQVATLSPLGKVDDKTTETFAKVMAKLHSKRASQSTLRLYLKPKSELNEVMYNRVCTVTFPLAKELASDDATIFGVNMRKMDKKAIAEAYQLILPKMHEEQAYSHGSHSGVAPYFDALMGAFHNVMTEMNSISYQFRGRMDKKFNLHDPLDWYPLMSELGQFSGLIPSLLENRGDETSSKIKEEDDEVSTLPEVPVRETRKVSASTPKSAPASRSAAPEAPPAPVVDTPPAPARNTTVPSRAAASLNVPRPNSQLGNGNDDLREWDQMQAQRRLTQSRFGYHHPQPGHQMGAQVPVPQGHYANSPFTPQQHGQQMSRRQLMEMDARRQTALVPLPNQGHVQQPHWSPQPAPQPQQYPYQQHQHLGHSHHQQPAPQPMSPNVGFKHR